MSVLQIWDDNDFTLKQYLKFMCYIVLHECVKFIINI